MDEEEDSLERLAKRIIRINIKSDGDDYSKKTYDKWRLILIFQDNGPANEPCCTQIKIKNHLAAYLCFGAF